MRYKWHCCCWAFVVMVVRTVAATPLASPPNNYQMLTNHQVWEVSGQDAIKVLMGLEVEGLVDILSHSLSTPRVRIFPESLATVSTALNQAGIPYKVLVHDLATNIKEQQRATRKVLGTGDQESCTKKSCPVPLNWQYMTFEQMEWYLKDLAATSPRVKLESIGKSIEQRDIWRVHIMSTDKVRDAPTKGKNVKQNAIWLEAGIHAREWISPAVTLHLIHYIVANKKLTQNLDVYAVPMANPDGYEYSRTTDRLWRKNRRFVGNSKCSGVDLNRNWNEGFGVGASSNPCSEVYKGTGVFSEPETQALKDDMLKVSNKHNLYLVLALHSYGRKLIYPWGWTSDPAPDTPMMRSVGKMFAEYAKKYHGTKYKVANSAEGLYYASGATDDWSKAALKTPLAYTLELSGGDHSGFELPSDMIEPNSIEVWKGLKKVLSFINKKWKT